MKTERRHELQTNWLADRVGEALIVLKPYMKGLVGVLLAVLVVWVAIMYMAHRSAAEEAGGWNKLWGGLLGGSNAAEDLATLSESRPKQPTGQWALLYLADNNLTNGVGLLFIEKKAGRDAIRTALENYKSVLQNSTDTLVREHALYGVGRAQESLCNLADARKAYEQLSTDYPTGSYSARAKERLEDLARDSTTARYDWFKGLEPPASGLGKGLDQTEGTSGPQLSPELQPFSQFATPEAKTPPPEPKPDTGATVPTTPKPGNAKTPDAKTPDTKTPDTKTPDTKTPDAKTPDAKTPDAKTPDTKTPDTKTPDTKTPDTKTPDTKAPDDKASGKADEKPPAVPKPDDSK